MNELQWVAAAPSSAAAVTGPQEPTRGQQTLFPLKWESPGDAMAAPPARRIQQQQQRSRRLGSLYAGSSSGGEKPASSGSVATLSLWKSQLSEQLLQQQHAGVRGLARQESLEGLLGSVRRPGLPSASAAAAAVAAAAVAEGIVLAGIGPASVPCRAAAADLVTTAERGPDGAAAGVAAATVREVRGAGAEPSGNSGQDGTNGWSSASVSSSDLEPSMEEDTITANGSSCQAYSGAEQEVDEEVDFTSRPLTAVDELCYSAAAQLMGIAAAASGPANAARAEAAYSGEEAGPAAAAGTQGGTKGKVRGKVKKSHARHGPGQCSNCGTTKSSSWSRCKATGGDLCKTCYMYAYRTGRMRPRELFNNKKNKKNRPRCCFHCYITEARHWYYNSNGDDTCVTCWQYARRHGGKLPPMYTLPRPPPHPRPPGKKLEGLCGHCSCTQSNRWYNHTEPEERQCLKICHACYQYRLANGKMRPEHLWNK